MSESAEPRRTVFEPGPLRRRQEYLRSTLTMLAVAVIAAPLGMLAVGLLVKDFAVFGDRVGWYAFGIVLLLSVWLGWRCVQRRLQFAVELGPTGVHFGRGLLRGSAGYEDVEIIRIEEDPGAKTDHASHSLTIQARGKRRQFALEGAEQECAELLFERCPDAVYIDAFGQEHESSKTKRPLYVMDRLARNRVRRGWRTMVLSLLFLAWGVPVSVALLVRILQGAQKWSMLLDYRVSLLLFITACGFVVLFAGLARIHKGRRLVAQATRLEALGIGELDEAVEQEAG